MQFNISETLHSSVESASETGKLFLYYNVSVCNAKALIFTVFFPLFKIQSHRLDLTKAELFSVYLALSQPHVTPIPANYGKHLISLFLFFFVCVFIVVLLTMHILIFSHNTESSDCIHQCTETKNTKCGKSILSSLETTIAP